MEEKLETEEERYLRRRKEFIEKVSHAVNYSSLDTFCDMRDYVVAEYLWNCLLALAEAHTKENHLKQS